MRYPSSSSSSHRHPPHHRCRPHRHPHRLVVVVVVSLWHLPWVSHCRHHRSWGGVVVVVNDTGRGVEWWVAVTSSLIVILVVVVIPIPLVGQGGGGGVATTVVPVPLVVALAILVVSTQGRVVVGSPSSLSCPSTSSLSRCHCRVDAGKGGWGRCRHARPPRHPRCCRMVEVVVMVVRG